WRPDHNTIARMPRSTTAAKKIIAPGTFPASGGLGLEICDSLGATGRVGGAGGASSGAARVASVSGRASERSSSSPAKPFCPPSVIATAPSSLTTCCSRAENSAELADVGLLREDRKRLLEHVDVRDGD